MAVQISNGPSQKRPAYAGIGSRETPPAMLDLMVRAASQLAAREWSCVPAWPAAPTRRSTGVPALTGHLSSTCPGPPSRPRLAHPPAPQSSSSSGSRPRPLTSWPRSFPRLGRGCRRAHASCTRATAIRCSAPTWPARRVSCCAGRLTAAWMAAAGASAGAARRFGSLTTTTSRFSTSLAPSTPSAYRGAALAAEGSVARRASRGRAVAGTRAGWPARDLPSRFSHASRAGWSGSAPTPGGSPL